MGADGHPAAIFNKQTGEAMLGPKLEAKIIYVGSADSYFLNDAVYFIQDVLENLSNPPYDGDVKYGDRAEPCWNGDPVLPNHLSRLHYDHVPSQNDRADGKTARRRSQKLAY